MSSKHEAVDVPLGMMDGAYFTSRKDILDFFNSLLSMSLTKIEQTASGAVACQVFDYLFPGSIPMKRVNWEAKSEFQYIENYKILQAGFSKKRVQKQIDVDRLIRGRYQDNLEFCQWLKAFFEHVNGVGREGYDPVARRMMGKGGKKLDDVFLPRGSGSGSGSGSVSGSTSSSIRSNNNSKRGIKGGHSKVSIVAGTPRSNSNSNSSIHKNFPSSSSVCSTRSTSSKSTTSTAILRENNARPTNTTTSTMTNAASNLKKMKPMTSKKLEALEAECKDLKKKNTQMKRRTTEAEMVLENVENERDFYFEKLRGVEVMLQVYEEKKETANNSNTDGGEGEMGENTICDPEALIQRIFKVLYAKIEDNIIVTDDGELLADMEADEDLLNDSAISLMDDEPMVVG